MDILCFLGGWGREEIHTCTCPHNTHTENMYGGDTACFLRNEGLSSDARHQDKKPSVATHVQNSSTGVDGEEGMSTLTSQLDHRDSGL